MGEAKRRRLQLKHCYLCGELLSEPINYDHVPPAMFYGDDVRQKYSLKLLTIPVHQPCNSQWQKDEEYFVYPSCRLSRGLKAATPYGTTTFNGFAPAVMFHWRTR